ncbi:MAG: hypothetical protein F6K39_32775 [Okeania sp. SIO3B3]|nr:hypothetical protein [Okeania sp. SIO3B3]
MKVEKIGFDSQGRKHSILSYPLLPKDDNGNFIDLPVLVYDPNNPPYYYDLNKRYFYNSHEFLSQYSNYIQPGTIYFIPATSFPLQSHHLKQGVFEYTDLVDAAPFHVIHIMLCVVAKDEQGKTVFVIIESPKGYNALTKYVDTKGKDERFRVFGISRLKFPNDISLKHQAAYIKNITTMAAIFATYSEFPDTNLYKGDLIGIDSPSKVQEAGEMALLCVYGDERGRNWMRDKANKMYCSEMLAASIETGLNFLLTLRNLRQISEKYFPQVEQETFVKTVSQRINTGSFLGEISGDKKIPYIHYLKGLIGLIDSDLIDIKSFNQTLGITATDGSGLVIKPESFVDIAFRYFFRFYPSVDTSKLTGQERIEAIRYNEAVQSAKLQDFVASVKYYESIYQNFIKENQLKQWNIFKQVFEFYLRQKNIPSLSFVHILLQKTRKLTSDASTFMLPIKWFGSNITDSLIMDNQDKIDFEMIAWLMPSYAFYRYFS